MRRLLSFDCAGCRLGATADGPLGAVGLLMVTGGTQTRAGSHRMSERLAAALGREGYPCFRYDRRGVGDSEGEDPGFRGSGPDITAAAAAFRAECPGLERIVGLGLCDGATALALSGVEAALAGLILVNPWLVEAEAGAPPPAALRRHYRQRLLSASAWRRLLRGDISYRKALSGLRRAAAPAPSTLASEVRAELERSALPAELILARGDATAIAAEVEWRSFGRGDPTYVESDSHTFAKPGDQEALLAAVRSALVRLGGL
jgi:exosortase A-associated hydrolase 1